MIFNSLGKQFLLKYKQHFFNWILNNIWDSMSNQYNKFKQFEKKKTNQYFSSFIFHQKGVHLQVESMIIMDTSKVKSCGSGIVLKIDESL